MRAATAPAGARRAGGAALRTTQPSAARKKSGPGGDGENSTQAQIDTSLSFAKCTLGDVLAAAVREHPNVKFYEHFWSAVLTQEHAEEFHSLANRTFPFWVEAFNKWLDLRRLGECSVRDMSINGLQIQPIFSLNKKNVASIIQLFDPEGYAQMNGQTSDRVLKRCIVSMPELATAGVLLSKLIPRRVKMNFLLGLFDLDDSGYLNEVQFTMFLKTFHHGLGAVFKVSPQQSASVPELRKRASELFSRALCISTLPGVAADGDCLGLCYDTLWEWWCGTFSDYATLALPYTLVMQRFASNTGFDAADCFDEDLHDFRLSHSAPMALKKERTTCRAHGSNTSMCKYLTEPVVLAARALFGAAQELLEDWKTFAAQEATLDAQVCDHALLKNESMRKHLLRELRGLCWYVGEQQGFLKGLDLTQFLRRLCPCALTKHLRMFDNFCERYDKRVRDLHKAELCSTAADVFAQYEAKPFLSERESRALRDEFAKLDISGRGFVNAEDITSLWGWSREQALETIESFDSAMDGVIDEEEFLRMMCPAEFRLPEMSGVGRELVGKILAFERAALEKRTNPIDDDDADSVPTAVLPSLPDDVFAAWTEAWNTFNRSGGDLVTVPDLESSGLLSREVCQSLVRLIDPHNATGFTREAFFFHLCRAYGYRPRFEDACAVTARSLLLTDGDA